MQQPTILALTTTSDGDDDQHFVLIDEAWLKQAREAIALKRLSESLVTRRPIASGAFVRPGVWYALVSLN